MPALAQLVNSGCQVNGTEPCGERADWKWFDDKREEAPPE